MAEKFYTILTNIGKAQIANSGVMGSKVNFVKFKIGDSNGSYYDPTEDQRDLVNTVYEGNITDIEVDQKNPNWMKINLMIPANVGGFTIREYGVYDENGNMLAVAKCAESYKPIADDGSTKELILRMILAVSNTSSVNMELDPTLVFVSKDELEKVRQELTSQMNDLAYETAGGTSTAITLSMQALKNGYYKKFIANADNGGAATTVNGKPLYKVCSTNAPNIKASRPYEIYYNLASDCFFLKASATGTATPAQVLANVPFSNENDTDLIGTMPERGAPVSYINCGGVVNLQEGHYSGGQIIANSLASQTVSNAFAAAIVSGYHAWVNGIDTWGTATVQSLGGKQYQCGTTNATWSNTSGNIKLTLNLSSILGFTPSIVYGTAGDYVFIATQKGTIYYSTASGDNKYILNTTALASSKTFMILYRYVSASSALSSTNQSVTWYAWE